MPDQMIENRIVTCVYCGMQYPQGTPTHGASILTDHIKVCPQHPMRKAEEKIHKLRNALIALAGVETKEELEQMEQTLRSLASTRGLPNVEATLNVVHVLLETME